MFPARSTSEVLGEEAGVAAGAGMSGEEKLEIARRAFKDKEYKRAMFAARSVYSGATGRPYSSAAPEARYLVGRIYEARGLDQYAFEEYQMVQARYPNFPRRNEVERRQFEIAGRFLGGQRFKFKIPYQETVFIPLFPSMSKTAKMYSQMITNAPFSSLGAEAQLNIGQAYEKRMGGWFGTFFAPFWHIQSACWSDTIRSILPT